ncbi:hypothetical protein CHS0354_006100 [Potamilus streckersoni]|uniref:Uncharacterized protein n=1 Tax=Potamilus streckersoni TaxID=2493646 RepID=A0AAE0SU66_9BIVA|nr:hypothetical protein CHS0354_006100 [Potamilus streckersoni]
MHHISQFRDFFICPGMIKDSLKCEGVRLYEKKKKLTILQEWNNEPDISKTVALLNDKDMSKMRMSYKVNGHWRKADKLSNFIKGHVCYEKETYFHIGKEWCIVQIEYLRMMEKKFFDLVKEKLAIKLSDGALPLPWNSEKHKGMTLQKNPDQYIHFCQKVLRKELSDEEKKEIINRFPSYDQGASSSQLEEGIVSEEEDDNNSDSLSEDKRTTVVLDKKKRCSSIVDEIPNKKPKIMSKILGEEYNLYLECFEPREEDQYNTAYYVYLNKYLNENRNSKLSKFLRVDSDSSFPPFLLGDKILLKNLPVELFDILKITGDKLYLYHVKTPFGQKTRDAVSQILNSASLLHKAVFSNKKHILGGWYDNVVMYKGDELIRNILKQEMKEFDKEKFIDLFYKKTIVYVYGFQDQSKERKPFQEIVSDRQRLFERKHLCKALNLEQKLEKVDTLCEILKSRKIISDANGMFKVEKGFQGLTKRSFFEFLNRKDAFFETRKQEIFDTLQMYWVPTVEIKSYIAKFELLRLAEDFKNYYYPFELKLCQIKKPLESIT